MATKQSGSDDSKYDFLLDSLRQTGKDKFEITGDPKWLDVNVVISHFLQQEVEKQRKVHKDLYAK